MILLSEKKTYFLWIYFLCDAVLNYLPLENKVYLFHQLVLIPTQAKKLLQALRGMESGSPFLLYLNSAELPMSELLTLFSQSVIQYLQPLTHPDFEKSPHSSLGWILVLSFSPWLKGEDKVIENASCLLWLVVSVAGFLPWMGRMLFCRNVLHFII